MFMINTRSIILETAKRLRVFIELWLNLRIRLLESHVLTSKNKHTLDVNSKMKLCVLIVLSLIVKTIVELLIAIIIIIIMPLT